MTVKGLRLLLIGVFSAVLLLMVSAPLAMPYGSVNGLEGGHPVEPDFFDTWDTLEPLPAMVYAVGDILCHQDASRSFELNGSQLPICVRDLSALMGMIAGLALCIFCGDRLRTYAFPLLLVSFVLMIADVVIQNSLDLNVFATRILTGAFCGIAVSAAVDRWLTGI